MARTTKKEKMLTTEEKLAQALVPETEQPYKVPKNWCWVLLENVLVSIKEKEDSFDKTLKYVGLENIEKETGQIDFQSADAVKSTKNIFYKGNILYGRLRPYLNKHGIVPFGGVCSTDILVFDSKEVSSNQLVDYFFHLPFFIQYVVSNSKGINLPRVSEGIVLNAKFPLPPLKEQQRIVDRIESLFAKLDEAKEKAQSVVDGFENRKAAILNKAFTGELTAEWRKNNLASSGHWVKKRLGDCGKWMGGGTPSKAHPEYWDNGDILWVTSKDMKSDLIEDTQLHTNMLGVNNSSTTYIEKPSILFVMRSGILRHTLPIAVVKTPFTVNQDLKALSPDNIDIDYLFWACESEEKHILDNCMKNGTTVESINATALMNFEIAIAPVEEQQIIVSMIVSVLHKEQKAKEAAERVIEKIDIMKKSILARAFRGELGTNDPTDEPAEELLKRVL